jgi:hypothetical protein
MDWNASLQLIERIKIINNPSAKFVRMATPELSISFTKNKQGFNGKMVSPGLGAFIVKAGKLAEYSTAIHKHAKISVAFVNYRKNKS